jgi:tyrosine-protein kinase
MFAERVSRVTALSRSAEPVEVARAAAAPQDPVSPRPLRNGVIGALIGLVVGLLIAFVRDSFDRRLRGARDIEDELGLPLLGHVSADAMGRAVVSNNGHKVLTEQDLESFRILRTNLEFLDVDNPARSVVVTSGLPGEGKSTVSTALAATSALSGKRTLLVECDLRRPQVADRFGLPDGPGLAEYLAGKAEPKEVLRKIVLAPSSDGNGNGAKPEADAGAPSLMCITAGTAPPRPAEMLGSQKFATFLEEVRDAYDFVALDSSPLLSVSDTLELVPRVDAVILCIRAAQTTQEQARAAAIERLPDKPTALVVTGIKPGEAENYGYYSYAYGR